MNRDAIVGCILGTAIGDAIGLPYEGVSPERSRRLLGPPDRHRFVFGRGMISDDTEHTCMVAQSLIESDGDVELFTKRFASRLRWWVIALPAGVGKATARAGLKLWLGASPEKAGVYSAGNGPAMRAALFGATMDDRAKMLEFIRASTRLTHTDRKAEFGAIAVALAAQHARQNPTVDAERWLAEVADACGEAASELIELLRRAIHSVKVGELTTDFARSIDLKDSVSGYTYHTVPVAVHAWLSHSKNLRAAIRSTIECGGDADTTAAIVGGIVGCGVGESGLPDDWLSGIKELPRSVDWMQCLGEALAETMKGHPPKRTPSINPITALTRNLFFLSIVLCHGFRRLAPPY
ncbi:ADP-ribosylglycohydrolase family protein [Rhodopirellula sp. JC740]|uniref:ADP-ribosylglycohydrolase family protein n=1 Tax=Rhodopirellula halodulae TaxID=2894198 RepID=A0ABS8NFZ5_9BACT|nr:ADP-ribosylglycohydrolase family protein [Rhodopirellula sp. JC740]MCC9642469.1 ADP-ribosylglycohydrolase family protein [Rhodopirellula sp. JC740]